MGLPPTDSTKSILRNPGLAYHPPRLNKRHAASVGSDRPTTLFNNITESRKDEPNERAQPKQTVEQAQGPDGQSLTSKDSEEATEITSTFLQTARSVGDTDVEPTTTNGGLMASRWADPSESSAPNGANSDASDGVADSIASFNDDYEESDIPGSAVDWTAIVERMDALSLGVDLRLEEDNASSAVTSTASTTSLKEETKASFPADPVECLAGMLASLSLGTNLRSNWKSGNVFAVFLGASSSINEAETKQSIPDDPMSSLANTMAKLSLGTRLPINMESYDPIKPFLGHSFSISREDTALNRPDTKEGSTRNTTATPTDSKMDDAPVVAAKLDNIVCSSEDAGQPPQSSQHSTTAPQTPSIPGVSAASNSDMDCARAAIDSTLSDITEVATGDSSASLKNTKPCDAHVVSFELDDSGYVSGEPEEPASGSQAPLNGQLSSDVTADIDLESMIMKDGSCPLDYLKATNGKEAEEPINGIQQSTIGQQDSSKPELNEITGDGPSEATEAAASDLQESHLDDASQADHGTSKDDDPAQEMGSSPPSHAGWLDKLEDLTDRERVDLGEVDQADGSDVSHYSFDEASAIGESEDVEWENVPLTGATTTEPTASDLEDSDIDVASIAEHGTSNNDDPARETLSSPAPRSGGNDTARSSPYSAAPSAPHFDSYCNGSSPAYVLDTGSGKPYKPQIPSTNSARPTGPQNPNTTGSSKNIMGDTTSRSLNLTKTSVGDTPEAAHNMLPPDTGILGETSLCWYCNDSELAFDDEFGICFSCSTYTKGGTSLATAASTPVTDSVEAAVGPHTDSGNRKRRRSSVSGFVVETEDVSENIDQATPNKRGRVRDGNDSAVRTAFAMDPMYPTEEYEPLKGLSIPCADLQIRDWMKRSMRCLLNLIGHWEKLRADGHGDRSCFIKLEPYMRHPNNYKEIQATYHRLSQLNSHGEEAINHGHLKSVIFNREKVKEIRAQYKRVEDGLAHFEKLFEEEFDDIFNGIRDQFFRFMDLTGGM